MFEIERSRRSGFSLIELLVVVTIIIVLTTIGLVSYRQASRNSRNAKRKSDLETARQALVLYRYDIGLYPSGSNFNLMIDTITGAGYISVDSLTDPKSPTYDYEYNSDGSIFELCATLETSAGTDPYCINNP